MRLRRHGSLFGSTLKCVSTRPVICSHYHRHQYSTTRGGPPQHVAVLGGGISGLASAYYISKELPTAKITVYEAGPRLGGWLHSSHVEVPGGRVLFEHGPRSLRPGVTSIGTSSLIQELGLIPDVIYTDKLASSAVNRFIYYPDHLVRMPNPFVDSPFTAAVTLLEEPVFKGSMSALIREPFRKKRPGDLEDESVGSFVARRLNPALAQNIVSAVLHGIYAGDVNQLSIRAILPMLWHLEQVGGSIVGGLSSRSPNKTPPNSRYDVNFMMEITKRLDPDFKTALENASIFSFRNGIQQLVDRLAETVQDNKRITMKLGVPVTHIDMQNDSKYIKVSAESESQNYDLIVSSIFSKRLSELCTFESTTLLPALAKTYAVTVMVVNLFYSNPNLLPVEGFGYLIPQSVPFYQNPERALGVIFDSDTIKGQDMATGTKLTVMLGGHWWDGWSSYPTEAEGIASAKSILARHLHIKDQPVAAQAKLQKDCIPQYTVGHHARLAASHSQLLREFKGKLRVVGNSYSGVGVNDCILAARYVAQDLGETKTGLEHLYN